MRRSVPSLLLALVIGAGPAPAWAAVDPEKEQLLDRLRAVEDELAVVRRQVEVKQEDDAKKAATAPLVSADRSGFQIQSPDKKSFRLRLRGYLHSDGRYFTEGGQTVNNEGFYLRRARILFEGTLFENVDFRFMPDFGVGSSSTTTATASIQDAWVNLRYWELAQLQSGKFKSPFGLERLQSATAITFIERGLPTEVVPNRDIGAMLQGDWRQGLLTYQVAAMNGVSDGGSADGDTNDGKELVARIFGHPFQETTLAPLHGLGLGFAVAGGQQDTVSGTNYRTAGRNTFFRYGSTVKEDGARIRFSPQAYWYWGPFGAMFEWVRSNPHLQLPSGPSADPDIDAWQIAASYVLTGEDVSYRGVIPRSPFRRDGSGWGAWEIAARYSELEVDDEVFDLGFASPNSNAEKAQAWTAGVNWYLNPFVKLSLNYDQTIFDGGAPGGGDRPTEGTLATRVQLAY